MPSVTSRRYTELEYLLAERDLETKHELYRGEMFAMSGASRQHNQITFNLAFSLGKQLEDRECTAYVADMRVKVSAAGLYTYPDAVITCEEPQFEPEFEDEILVTLLNPQVVIEVLFDSTEKYDRGKKFEQYRQLPSLQEYVLVSQDHLHIERFVRGPENHWTLSEATGLESTIELPVVDCNLPLAEVFAKVVFSEAGDE